MGEEVISAKLRKWDTFQYERVGLTLRPELVAVKDMSGDAGQFKKIVGQVFETSNFSLILMSDKPEVLKEGLSACPGGKPLLYAATKDNGDAMAELAKEANCPLAVKGDGLEEVIALTDKLTQAGLKDLVLDSGARTIKKVLEDQVAIRRTALSGRKRAWVSRPSAFPVRWPRTWRRRPSSGPSWSPNTATMTAPIGLRLQVLGHLKGQTDGREAQALFLSGKGGPADTYLVFKDLFNGPGPGIQDQI